MTSHDREHYSKKHSGERKVNPVIVNALEEKASDKKITCAGAFKIADTCGTTADEIGFTLDMIEIRIIRCQMGIFGYEPEKKVVKPMDNVPDELEEAIGTVSTENLYSSLFEGFQSTIEDQGIEFFLFDADTLRFWTGNSVSPKNLIGTESRELDVIYLDNGWYVKKILESGYLYVGSPVKQARPLNDKERAFLQKSADNYVQNKNDYLDSVLPV